MVAKQYENQFREIERDLESLRQTIAKLPGKYPNQRRELEANLEVYEAAVAMVSDDPREEKLVNEILKVTSERVVQTMNHAEGMQRGQFDNPESEDDGSQPAHLRAQRRAVEALAEELDTDPLRQSIRRAEAATAESNNATASARKAESALEEAKDAFVQLSSRTEETLKKAREALETSSAKNVAESIGSWGAIYKQDAERYGTQAEKFLSRVFWVLGVSLVLLIASFCVSAPGGVESSHFVIALSLFRFTFVAFGVALVAFFSKQYSAAAHAKLTAEHRFRIAHTYMEIQKNLVDQSAREAVMLSVVQAMVQEPSSPHIKGDQSSSSVSVSEVKSITDLLSKS